jgi:hypothetical protein
MSGWKVRKKKEGKNGKRESERERRREKKTLDPMPSIFSFPRSPYSRALFLSSRWEEVDMCSLASVGRKSSSRESKRARGRRGKTSKSMREAPR